jgi:hypothetical protein
MIYTVRKTLPITMPEVTENKVVGDAKCLVYFKFTEESII